MYCFERRHAVGAIRNVEFEEAAADDADRPVAGAASSTRSTTRSRCSAVTVSSSSWNPGAENLFGWSADEAIGRRSISELVFTGAPSAERGDQRSARARVSRGRVTTTPAARTARPCSCTRASRRCETTTGEVVADRHRFERRLRASLAGGDGAPRRGALAERVRDRPHGRVDVGTPRPTSSAGTSTWRPATGLSPGAFGGTFEEFISRVHPDDRERSGPGSRRRPRMPRATSCPSTGWCGPTARSHWLEARGRSLHDDDGVFVGMVGVGIDIDERKQLEALMSEASQLRATAELVSDLQEAERIARLGSWRWEAGTNTVTLSAEMARMLAARRSMTGQEFAEALQRGGASRRRPGVDPFGERGPHQWSPAVRDGVPARRERKRPPDGPPGRDPGRRRHEEARRSARDVPGRHRAARWPKPRCIAARERLARERRAVEVLQETLIRPGFPTLDRRSRSRRDISPPRTTPGRSAATGTTPSSFRTGA